MNRFLAELITHMVKQALCVYVDFAVMAIEAEYEDRKAKKNRSKLKSVA